MMYMNALRQIHSIRMQPSTKAYWISKHLHDIRKPSVDQGFQLLFQYGLAQKLTEYECTEKNVNAILHLIAINAALLLETTCKNKKYIKKSNMVCLLVGSDARVNNIANQTKSSNKIF